MASNKKRNNQESYDEIASRIEDSFDFSVDLYRPEIKQEKNKRYSKLTPYQEKMLEFFSEPDVLRIITSDYIYQRPRKEDLLKWQRIKAEETR